MYITLSILDLFFETVVSLVLTDFFDIIVLSIFLGIVYIVLRFFRGF